MISQLENRGEGEGRDTHVVKNINKKISTKRCDFCVFFEKKRIDIEEREKNMHGCNEQIIFFIVLEILISFLFS